MTSGHDLVFVRPSVFPPSHPNTARAQTPNEEEEEEEPKHGARTQARRAHPDGIGCGAGALPRADTAVSAVVAQVEQAQQLVMVMAAAVAQVDQVQQLSMTTTPEVQQALLAPLQMHPPTSPTSSQGLDANRPRMTMPRTLIPWRAEMRRGGVRTLLLTSQTSSQGLDTNRRRLLMPRAPIPWRTEMRRGGARTLLPIPPTSSKVWMQIDDA